MSKRQKIIISITGITLVLLILVGLTYAYFLTRIQGNTNEKSISTTTAYLEVKYQDGSDGVIIGEKIKPGTTFTKNFSVKNIGDNTGNYSIILDNIENTMERTWDVRYTLKTKDGKELVKGTLGKLRKQIVYADIDIEVDATDEYIFELEYEEANEDQSIDMKKEISLKIDIIAAQENIFKNIAEEGTLLYAIGRDNKIIKPLTIPGKEVSKKEEAELTYTEDDYGTSYYFRGTVENNYITFAGMCWRIVRILGNGDIKITLADKEYACNDSNYGINVLNAFIGASTYYDSQLQIEGVNYDNSNVKEFINEWLTTTGIIDNENIDNLAEWCVDISEIAPVENRTGIYFGSYGRFTMMAELSLKCNFIGENGSKAQRYQNGVALLNADEVRFAGAPAVKSFNEVVPSYLTVLLTPDEDAGIYGWWTMTPFRFYPPSESHVFSVRRDLGSWYNHVTGKEYVRPAIIFKSSTQIIKGTGTQLDPYVIS